MNQLEAVVVGVSAGGLKALVTILAYLPADYHLPVIIVQHLLEGSDSFLVDYLNEQVSICVKEAADKEAIRPGYVYVAPPGYHLLIEDERMFSLSMDPKVNYSRPSIDVLFDSAAFVFQEKCLGIVLTGANRDGSEGLRNIKMNGGQAIIQDPATAEYNIMPLAAMSVVKVDHILALDEIGKYLLELQPSNR
ncbi:chemotaxis protein CheB [Paenibacillus sp. FSL H7-0331]|uniref:chemotaxis protein CheB n=1 Tax=Paenibacillus sp. FSL H7-0331 TaxID=1920421 RepID=UPI00096D4E37|nr:chemotaxis protein CheB [Paenibacillus sp. FSL H7-0331]OMF18692.1 chemotaxis protein CheB [Paenibacillus sp. FSL H7-0331]